MTTKENQEIHYTIETREEPTVYDNDLFSLLESKNEITRKICQINPSLCIVSRPGEEYHFEHYDLFVLNEESISHREAITEKLREIGSEIRYSIQEILHCFTKHETIQNENWDFKEHKMTLAIKRTAFHKESGFSLKRFLVDTLYYCVILFLSYTMYQLMK
jgi:hypothetical protein